ncbi:SEC-C metal-binding domain-containing protein, partial [Mesorhizobium sp. ZMM04-5]
YLPDLTADEVAASAWRGFRRGKRMVVPGLASKAAALLTWLVPTGLILPKVASVQKRKNDLCPCGSGKVFIRCCGMTRRFRREHGGGTGST